MASHRRWRDTPSAGRGSGCEVGEGICVEGAGEGEGAPGLRVIFKFLVLIWLLWLLLWWMGRRRFVKYVKGLV